MRYDEVENGQLSGKTVRLDDGRRMRVRHTHSGYPIRAGHYAQGRDAVTGEAVSVEIRRIERVEDVSRNRSHG